jgi:UDP-N-acetylenolpyruvoylglucosamine reductase
MTESDEIRRRLLRHISALEEHFPLSRLNPLGCGGVADFYTEVNTSHDLIDAVQGAVRSGVPYLVIGEGRHVLFSDGGFPGLVIQNRCQQLVVSPEHTRIMVDAGLSLDTVIARIADQGLGGLELFYGQDTTVGAAVYNGLTVAGMSILSIVRGVTILQPRTEGDAALAVVQHPGEWLKVADGPSRIYRPHTGTGDSYPPIILSVALQGTRLRQDELLLRLHDRLSLMQGSRPRGDVLGPIFYCPEGMDLNLMLKESNAYRLRVGGVFPDRHAPNYLRRKGTVQAKEVGELIGAMRQRVFEHFGFDITSKLEPVGVW